MTALGIEPSSQFVPDRPRFLVAQCFALLRREFRFTGDFLDAVDALDQRQAFGRKPAATMLLLRFQRLVEFPARMRKAAEMHDAIAFADGDITVVPKARASSTT